MNIVERRMIELTATLPSLTDGQNLSFKPSFDFGSHADLMRFLVDRNDAKVSPYPLIWLDTKGLKPKGDRDSFKAKLKLIIAINSESEYSNSERLTRKIYPYLEPTCDNLLRALRTSNISQVIKDDEIETELFYNYAETNDEEGEVIEIWDAIKFQLEVEFNNNILKTCIDYERR